MPGDKLGPEREASVRRGRGKSRVFGSRSAAGHGQASPLRLRAPGSPSAPGNASTVSTGSPSPPLGVGRGCTRMRPAYRHYVEDSVQSYRSRSPYGSPPGSWRSKGLRAASPPLPCSLAGRPPRNVTPQQVRRGLPPGVVVFPSGNMLLTASVGATNKDRVPTSQLEYVQFRDDVKAEEVAAVPHIHLTAARLAELAEEFEILRMTFPMRCLHLVCATLDGPLREVSNDF